MNPNQPRPKKLKSLRARYDAPTYKATIHRLGADGEWIVEDMYCLCSQKAKEDVDALLAEVDRLNRFIDHLRNHHVLCEECVEYVTPRA